MDNDEMNNIPITCAGFSYWDRTGPLQDGTVCLPGIDLTYVALPPLELGLRLNQKAEFDAGELWGMSHIAMVSRGNNPYVGVPIFPSRAFRHGNIFVNSAAGIDTPSDLVGRRIAIGEYAMTAIVWARAILQHDYGVNPAEVEWVLTAEKFHTPVDPPAGVKSSTAAPGANLETMLLEGEVDAYIAPTRPRSLLAGDPRIQRLFPDFWQVEKEYFRRTGFFPIMHLIGVRADVYERHRWLPNSLLRGFEAAKRVGRHRLQETGSLRVSLPSLPAALEEAVELFGDDPFPYGFEANYEMLEAMTQYAYEQGVSTRKVNPEELFAPETLDVVCATMLV